MVKRIKTLLSMNLSFFGGGGGGGFRGTRGSRGQQRRSSGSTPGDNRAQNREFRGAVQQLRREGINLNDTQIQRLHQAISKQGLDFWEIVEVGRSMFE